MIYAIHSTLNGIILVLAVRIDGSMARHSLQNIAETANESEKRVKGLNHLFYGPTGC